MLNPRKVVAKFALHCESFFRASGICGFTALVLIVACLCGSIARSADAQEASSTSNESVSASPASKFPKTKRSSAERFVDQSVCGVVYTGTIFGRILVPFTPPREPTDPAEARLRHACFARALAECRPGKLVEIAWGGKSRTVKTVVPLKDGSCAMRIESNGPRKIATRA